MFSQKSIDKMSVEELIKLIRTMTYSIENRLDDYDDALDHTDALCNLAQSLHDKMCEKVL
jgi:hypothetical protein